MGNENNSSENDNFTTISIENFSLLGQFRAVWEPTEPLPSPPPSPGTGTTAKPRQRVGHGPASVFLRLFEMSSASSGTSAAGTTVATEVAARLLMLTPARLGQLVKDGWIERSERGRYPLISLVQGYIRFLKDEARRSSKSAKDSRVKELRAQELEQRIAIKDRQLVDLDEAVEAMDVVVGAVRAELAGIPARVTRDLERRREIEQAVDEALERISSRLAERASALRSGGEALETEPEDDAR